jgi:hypothetical protein
MALIVIVGGAIRSRGGIAGVVVTTAATSGAFLVAIATIAVVFVLVPVVGVVIAFTRRARWRLWSCGVSGILFGVERRRSSNRTRGVQLDFLWEKIILNLKEVRKR